MKSAISGFVAAARLRVIGIALKHLRKHLLMVGCALAIFIAATRTDFGGTWAAAMTASNQQANGFRRWKSKAFWRGTMACAPLRWSKGLIRMDCRACVRLWFHNSLTRCWKTNCAIIAKRYCQDSSSRAITSLLMNCLTLRPEKCRDLSCEKNCVQRPLPLGEGWGEGLRVSQLSPSS